MSNRQAKKKQKDNAPSGDDSPSDDGSTSDGGVSAIAERVEQAAEEASIVQAHVSTARMPRKRIIHVQKYANMSAEAILSEHTVLYPPGLQLMAMFSIEALMDKWRSNVYKHFKTPEIIPPQAGTGGPHVHRFRCKLYMFIFVQPTTYFSMFSSQASIAEGRPCRLQ